MGATNQQSGPVGLMDLTCETAMQSVIANGYSPSGKTGLLYRRGHIYIVI